MTIIPQDKIKGETKMTNKQLVENAITYVKDEGFTIINKEYLCQGLCCPLTAVAMYISGFGHEVIDYGTECVLDRYEENLETLIDNIIDNKTDINAKSFIYGVDGRGFNPKLNFNDYLLGRDIYNKYVD